MTQPVPFEEVSVLIVTHERPQLLHALLESLVQQAANRWARVVVVDDSHEPSPANTRFPGLALDYQVLAERVHITRAKNLGLAAIQSPFVLIIDDDNTVTDSTFERPLRRLAEDPKLGAVMPSVLYRDVPDLVWVYATPFLRGRWGFDLVGRNRARDPALEGRSLPTDALPNAAFFRTTALQSVGGYDERYPVNSSADLCQRLKKAGWRVEADTGAFVLHAVEAPGRPGYWAAHTSTDPARTYHETRDWFRFEYAMHAGDRILTLRALYHASGWILPLLLALAIRRGASRRATTAALLRGVRDAVRARAG
ncbi:MAG: glycosyltransferase [Thermoplasmata archaeon]|nr:glycosyltransferase [Thermoplasmata archaeon]